MPTEKLSMCKIKEVLRLHHEEAVGTSAEQMRRLQRNTHLVFDYLRMTQNSAATAI